MIHAEYNVDKYALTVSGHALAGEHGHDLVCAAVSALVNTLALNVLYMEEKNLVHSSTVQLEEGNAVVTCEPMEDDEVFVPVVFAVIWHGLAKLAMDYPENIYFRLQGTGVEICDLDFVNS